MATSLIDSISSIFVESTNALNSKGRKEIVQVWVEDYLDVHFWKGFLSKYNSKYDFKISPYCINGKETPGKGVILNHVKDSQLGKNLIVCIDSDFDEIIETEYSARIKACKYILTTYYHSIENHFCHSSQIGNVLNQLVLSSDANIDFESILGKISKVLSKLFLLSLFFGWDDSSKYSIRKFNSLIKKLNLDLDGSISADTQTAIVEEYKSCESLIAGNEEDLNKIENKLSEMGFSDNEYYLLYRGHDVFSFVKRTLEAMANSIRQKEKQKIYESNDTLSRKKDREVQYKEATLMSGKIKLDEQIDNFLHAVNCNNGTLGANKINEQIDSIFG